MNSIRVIITKGCKSCEIIKKLITDAIPLSGKTIDEVIYQDFEEVKKELKYLNIEDFPTVLLIKDSVVKFKFKGTRPAIVIAQWIKINL